jgi:hypothetical protein
LSINGSLTLLIRSENLNSEDVTKHIGLVPTKISKKGELISKALGLSILPGQVYTIKRNWNQFIMRD